MSYPLIISELVGGTSGGNSVWELRIVECQTPCGPFNLISNTVFLSGHVVSTPTGTLFPNLSLPPQLFFFFNSSRDWTPGCVHERRVFYQWVTSTAPFKFFYFETGSWYSAQVDLEHATFLLRLQEWWNYFPDPTPFLYYPPFYLTPNFSPKASFCF